MLDCRGGGRPFREVNSSGKHGTILHSRSVTFVARWDIAAHRPEQSICLVVFAQGAPLKGTFLCCLLPFVPSVSSFFLHPFHGEIGRASSHWGMGRGLLLGHCHPIAPLAFLILDKCPADHPRYRPLLLHRNSNNLLRRILRR